MHTRGEEKLNCEWKRTTSPLYIASGWAWRWATLSQAQVADRSAFKARVEENAFWKTVCAILVTATPDSPKSMTGWKLSWREIENLYLSLTRTLNSVPDWCKKEPDFKIMRIMMGTVFWNPSLIRALKTVTDQGICQEYAPGCFPVVPHWTSISVFHQCA